MFPVPIPVDDSGGVWLPTIQHTLPNVWRKKGLESLEAAKNDNAPVLYDMWNYRIPLLFCHVTNFLDNFVTLS